MRQLRTSSPVKRAKMYNYAFEAIVDQVQIAVKFPCRIAVSWNYGEGQIKTSASKPLISGVARFDEKLSFNAVVNYDEEGQRYYQQRTNLQISIITDNGTSLAGFVPIDLGALINRKDRKELFEVERCPDKKACVRMRISYRFLSDKPRNRVKLMGHQSEDSEFDDGNRSVTPRSEYVPKTQIVKKTMKMEYRDVPQVGKNNRQLIEKQLLILKSKATEYESKFKTQRAEKQRLADLLKSKQEVFFTMKTQIKRKQIEVEDVYRSLEEYRTQYERVKALDENNRKDSDKIIKNLESNERQLNDRIAKQDTEINTLQRKSQKLTLELEKLKKQKDGLTIFSKEKSDELLKQKESFNQQIRQLKKEREEQVKALRLQKQNLERNVRQLTKNLRQTTDDFQLTKTKLSNVEKKLAKTQQTRNQQFHKFNAKINQLEKTKESLTIECENLKSNLTKREVNLNETSKSYELRLTEEKNTVTNHKSQLTELQLERATLQKDLAILKQTAKASDEQVKRLDKDNSQLRGQIIALSEQLQAKNVEIRGMTTKIKDLQEQIVRQQSQLTQSHQQTVNDLSSKLKQLKKTQQAKHSSTLKILSKKEKQLEETIEREHKLNLQLDALKDQYRKAEQLSKEKLESARKLENNLRMEIQQAAKRIEKNEQEANARYEALGRRYQALEENLSEHKQILSAATEREHKLRHQVQSLTQKMIYFEENKQLLAQYEDRLREYDKKMDELTEEIQNREVKEMGLNKQISDLKEKLIETETDRNKKEGLVKQKEKQLAASSKQANLEAEQRKKEISRRETQLKNLQDELRETIRKDRLKHQQLNLQNERLNNQVSIAQSTIEQYTKVIEQLHQDVRNFKDNQRSLLAEKQQLLRKRQQGEMYRRQLEQLRLTTQQTGTVRDKQLRTFKQQSAQLERAYSDLSKSQARNNLLVEQLCDIANRINSISLSSGILMKESTISRAASYSSNDYERLLDLRKLLVVSEGRWRKQVEIATEKQLTRTKEKERDSSQMDKLANENVRLKSQLQRMKKENEQLTYSSDFMKIQTQELIYKIEGLEADIKSYRSTIYNLENRTKQLGTEAERGQQDAKQLQSRYETLLEETRSTLAEKAEKTKKQLTALIRKHELKIEQMEEKNFHLELQNQKAGELAKRQEQNKKILIKAYQVERETQQQLQTAIQRAEKAERQVERLVWDKKGLEEAVAVTNTKLQRVSAQIQAELDKANTKVKELTNLVREKEALIAKNQQAFQKLNFQMTTLKVNSQEDKEKWTALEIKLRAQSAKFKTQATQLKKQYDEQRQQLLAMDGLKIVRAALQQQLQQKQKTLCTLQQKDEKQAEQIFKLSQKLQQDKWEFEMKLEAKQNENVSLQQQLYTMNSKQNVRILKETETYERIRQLENEKRGLVRQLTDLKEKWQEAEQFNRQLMSEQREIDELARGTHEKFEDMVFKTEEIEDPKVMMRNTLPY